LRGSNHTNTAAKNVTLVFTTAVAEYISDPGRYRRLARRIFTKFCINLLFFRLWDRINKFHPKDGARKFTQKLSLQEISSLIPYRVKLFLFVAESLPTQPQQPNG